MKVAYRREPSETTHLTLPSPSLGEGSVEAGYFILSDRFGRGFGGKAILFEHQGEKSDDVEFIAFPQNPF